MLRFIPKSSNYRYSFSKTLLLTARLQNEGGLVKQWYLRWESIHAFSRARWFLDLTHWSARKGGPVQKYLFYRYGIQCIIDMVFSVLVLKIAELISGSYFRIRPFPLPPVPLLPLPRPLLRCYWQGFTPQSQTTVCVSRNCHQVVSEMLCVDKLIPSE